MVVIDPSKGGNVYGVQGNGIVEKDFNLLISNYIYDRLNELGIDTKIIRTSDENISQQERVNRILNSYGNNSKVIALSNTLSNEEDDVQIIYPLRNNSVLSKAINDNLKNSNISVSKYYQKRSENDTSKDYYDIQKDTGNIQTIIISYGNVDNVENATNLKDNYKIYAEAVIKSIANYLGKPYFFEGENENIYVVKKGDSLYSIASKYNTTVNKLKELNNLKNNNLSIGQILKLPLIESGTNNQTYIVQKGDSLYSISNTYNTTVNELKKINNLSSNLLSIGQVLKLPQEQIISDNTYIVKKGDSLYSISNKYNTTVNELKNINNLSSNLLSVGQVLKLPTQKSNIYIVKKGDSLYSIASKYNTTVNELKKINNLSSNLLSIGQELKISN